MKKQKDGRYRTKIVVGHDGEGNSITKYVSGRTKKELAENIEELKKTYITGGMPVQRNILFQPYAEKWVAVYKAGLSASTTRNVSITLARLTGEFGFRQLRAITAADLQAFLLALSGIGRTTITDTLSMLKGIFRQAYADGILDRDPTVALSPPKYTTEKRREFTAAETRAVLALASRDKYGLMMYLLYYTGMRIGEVLGLRWTDIDFAERVIRVRRDVDFATGQIGAVKTKHSLRDVPIFDPLLPILDKHRKIGGYVISADHGVSHLSPSGYRKIAKRLAYELAQIDPSIEQKPDGADPTRSISVLTAHYYRHNFASLLYDAGVDILSAQQWLGHRDPETMLRIYAHLKAKRSNQSAQRVNILTASAAFSHPE